MRRDRTPDEIMQATRRRRGGLFARILATSPVTEAVGFVLLGIFLLGLATEPFLGVRR